MRHLIILMLANDLHVPMRSNSIMTMVRRMSDIEIPTWSIAGVIGGAIVAERASVGGDPGVGPATVRGLSGRSDRKVSGPDGCSST